MDTVLAWALPLLAALAVYALLHRRAQRRGERVPPRAIVVLIVLAVAVAALLDALR